MLTIPEIKTISNFETQISKVVKNISNYNDYDANQKELIDFINLEAKKCNIDINNIFDKQNDSTKKILEKFKNNNDEKIKTFFKELLIKISIKFPQYSFDIKKLSNVETFDAEINKFYGNFKKELVYSRKDFKNQAKILKEIGNSYYQRFKTEVGEVNLNGINSKTIENQFKEYTKLLSIIKNELSPLQEKIKKLQEAKTILIALSASFGITAAAFSFASIFCPPLAILASTFSIASIECGLISSKLKKTISNINIKVLKIIQNIKIFEKFNFEWFGTREYVEFANLLISGIREMISTVFPPHPFLNVTGGILSLIGASLDIKSCIESTEEIRKTIENQKNIYKKTIEINAYLKTIDHIKWSVVDETKQTAPYEKGGVGGKNLKFKNLKTQEIFTLETLLSYSKIKLNLLGLTKVYNSKLKEWYIKTLPNKILIDNLG